MDSAPNGETLLPPPLPPPRLSKRGLRILELCLVQTVAFGPLVFISLADFLSSLFVGGGGTGPDYSHHAPRSPSVLFNAELRYLSALAVCGYVLFRQGRSFRMLGLTWRKTDLLLAVALAAGSYIAYRAVHIALWDGGFRTAMSRGLGYYMDGFGTGGTLEVRLAISVYWLWHALVVGLFEEVLVRAYLMTEITTLTGSVPLAILVSVVLQSSYHLYQGWPSALSHVAGFLVFALFYAGTWRATPIILAHALIDLWGAWYQTWQ